MKSFTVMSALLSAIFARSTLYFRNPMLHALLIQEQKENSLKYFSRQTQDQSQKKKRNIICARNHSEVRRFLTDPLDVAHIVQQSHNGFCVAERCALDH